MNPHDKALVDAARSITNPHDWCDIPDENLAESIEAREILHRRSVLLYLREEGERI